MNEYVSNKNILTLRIPILSFFLSFFSNLVISYLSFFLTFHYSFLLSNLSSFSSYFLFKSLIIRSFFLSFFLFFFWKFLLFLLFISFIRPSWQGPLNTLTAFLQRGKTPTSNKCPWYNTKQSGGKVPVLELEVMSSTPSLPILPLWFWVIVSVRVT